MSSRRPSLQFIESRRCIGYRMDTYVMIFLVGASSQTGTSGNLAIDVCRAAPSPIVQSEQKKAAPNTDVVRANPFDCTRLPCSRHWKFADPEYRAPSAFAGILACSCTPRESKMPTSYGARG